MLVARQSIRRNTAMVTPLVICRFGSFRRRLRLFRFLSIQICRVLSRSTNNKPINVERHPILLFARFDIIIILPVKTFPTKSLRFLLLLQRSTYQQNIDVSIFDAVSQYAFLRPENF